VIEQLNIGIRFALYANLMLLFGLSLFALYALRGAERIQANILPLRALAGWLSASGIALSLLSITAMTASMAGVQLLEVDIASISMMIFETPMGNAWLVRVIALFATFAVALQMVAGKSLPKLTFVALGSGVALASVAWTGHGAANEGSAGTAQLIADIIHLLGAGAWLGALAALTPMLFRGAQASSEDYLRLNHRLLKGFSVAGSIIVALVLGSGLVNSWMLVGPQNMLSLHTTRYGQLLIAKLLLFAIMLALAAANRFTLTPALERALQGGGTYRARRRLQTSLIIELSLAAAIIGLVAWLGTLEPPVSR
jgi:putative copper resistance protein D